MNDAAGIVSGDEFLQKVKTETAFDAVSRGMNKAFAELEVSLLDEDNEAGQPWTSDSVFCGSYVESVAMAKLLTEAMRRDVEF
jgi:hypothetical protein